MHRLIIRLTVAFLTVMLGIIAAAIWTTIRFQLNDEINGMPQFQIVKSLSLSEEVVTNSSIASPIRRIDFANFTYPRVDEQGANSRRKTFTLKNGEYEETEGTEDGLSFTDGTCFREVRYGDVTGDGIEEALVILGERSGGSALVNYGYIYTLKNSRPSLLWSFEAGDRADGGVQKIYAENGELVIELYGKGTRIGGELSGTEITGACCPLSFTRTRYQWNGTRFVQKGEFEIFPT